jgi:hypothetical protein
MLQDWFGGGLGVLIFGAILLPAGGGLAWITDALDFRKRSIREKLAISLLAGLSVLPVPVYLSARFCSFWLTWILIVLLAGAGVWAYHSAPSTNSRLPLSLLGLILVWAAAALFLLSDLQLSPDRLYPSWTYGDYALRVPFTTTITEGGLPPQNLAYSPGKPVPLFYYYFWPMVCSLVDQAGGALVSARAAVFAGTIWIGLGLVSVYYLILRRRQGFTLGWFAFILLLIGGLDLLPLGLETAITLMTDRSALVRNAAIFLGTTGWNHAALVENWPNAVLWVPHHIASLLAGAFAALLLSRPIPAGKRAWIAPVLAGLSLASAAGYSLWVALVLAWALLSFFALTLLPEQRGHIEGRQRQALLLSGATAGLTFLPFLLELISAGSSGGIPLALYIRPFAPAHRLLAAILPQASPVLITGLDLLLLPLNYGLEFGFVGMLAWVGWRHDQNQPDLLDTLLGVLFWSSILISTFFRSTILNNDLAWRGILPAQFVLVVWAARSPAAKLSFWRNADYSKLLRTAWCLALVLGLSASTYDILSVRAYSLLKERLEEPDFGEVYIDLRQARQAIEVLLQPGTYVQASPDVAKNFHFGLYNTHPTLIADRYVLSSNRIPEIEYRPVFEAILAAFAAPTPREAAQLCERYHLNALLFSAWDPTWGHSSWQANVQALFDNEYTRLVACDDLLRWGDSP